MYITNNELYEQYNDLILRATHDAINKLGRLHSKINFEDVYMFAFENAIIANKNFKTNKNNKFSTYLYTCCHYKAIEFINKNKRTLSYSHVHEHYHKIGYNDYKFKKIKNRIDKLLKEGLITQETYDLEIKIAKDILSLEYKKECYFDELSHNIEDESQELKDMMINEELSKIFNECLKNNILNKEEVELFKQFINEEISYQKISKLLSKVKNYYLESQFI